jgi:hypothetical protein
MCTIKNYWFIISALGSAYINDYEKYTKETFYLLNFDVFVAVFFSPLNSLNFVKRLITSRYLFFCVNEYVYPFCLCFSPVALSLNFTHQNFARVVSLSLLNKPRFRYLRSSSWVELRLTRMFSSVEENYSSLIKINFRQIIQ